MLMRKVMWKAPQTDMDQMGRVKERYPLPPPPETASPPQPTTTHGHSHVFLCSTNILQMSLHAQIATFDQTMVRHLTLC